MSEDSNPRVDRSQYDNVHAGVFDLGIPLRHPGVWCTVHYTHLTFTPLDRDTLVHFRELRRSKVWLPSFGTVGDYSGVETLAHINQAIRCHYWSTGLCFHSLCLGHAYVTDNVVKHCRALRLASGTSPDHALTSLGHGHSRVVGLLGFP